MQFHYALVSIPRGGLRPLRVRQVELGTLGITLVEGGVVLVHYFGAVLVHVMMVALSVLRHF